jgi:hypothetical protein
MIFNHRGHGVYTENYSAVLCGLTFINLKNDKVWQKEYY